MILGNRRLRCRAALRDRIRAGLPIRADGAIHLVARAWALRGARE